MGQVVWTQRATIFPPTLSLRTSQRMSLRMNLKTSVNLQLVQFTVRPPSKTSPIRQLLFSSFLSFCLSSFRSQFFAEYPASYDNLHFVLKLDQQLTVTVL